MDRFVAIAQNDRGFDLVSILNCLIEMTFLFEIFVMNGQKIVYRNVKTVMWLYTQLCSHDPPKII